MSAEALREALRMTGIDAEVDADGSVAVLRLVANDIAMEDSERRREVVALAGRHGFRTIALEVAD